MEAFTKDEIELLQGLGILRDVYEEIIDEDHTVQEPECGPSPAGSRVSAARAHVS